MGRSGRLNGTFAQVSNSNYSNSKSKAKQAQNLANLAVQERKTQVMAKATRINAAESDQKCYFHKNLISDLELLQQLDNSARNLHMGGACDPMLGSGYFLHLLSLGDSFSQGKK